MNITDLKPGAYVRFTSSECGCTGCVLKYIRGSSFDRFFTIMETIRPVCGRFGNACHITKDDNIEILSPEEVMEVKLSR